MSITFSALKTAVSAALRDPDHKTFTAADVIDLINSGLAEVGRIAPRRFLEEITPVADQMSYIVLSGDFAGEANEDIEVVNVEVWDGSQSPPLQKAVVNPAHAEYIRNSDNGWTLWGGTLYIPTWVHSLIDGNEATYVIRVFGYAPYPELASDSDVLAASNEVKWALIWFCQMEALKRLMNERDLFTQWQTRAGNSDISPAGLMNAYNIARDEWRKRSRAISRLRSQV